MWHKFYNSDDYDFEEDDKPSKLPDEFRRDRSDKKTHRIKKERWIDEKDSKDSRDSERDE